MKMRQKNSKKLEKLTMCWVIPKNDKFMNNREDLPETNLPGEDQKMLQDPGQDQNLEIMDFVIFWGGF